MGWFRKSERIKELEGQAQRWYERWASTDLELYGIQAELAAEKAKKKCTECHKTFTYTAPDGGTWLLTCGSVPKAEYDPSPLAADPEAARIAALPKCGTTKKCPKCGFLSFSLGMDRSMTGEAPMKKVAPEHQYLTVACNRCGWAVQERPLFNPGVKGNK